MTWPHDAGLLFVAWYAFSALVSGMPEPDAKSSKGYQWLYSSLHVLAGDLVTAAKQHSAALGILSGNASK